MIKMLVIISLLVTLAGAFGIWNRNISKRLYALLVSAVGTWILSCCILKDFLVIMIPMQLVFRGVGLLLFWVTLQDIRKKNDIQELEELNGVRKFAPYVFLLLVLEAMMIIGVPGTGSFLIWQYDISVCLQAESNVFMVVGLLSVLAGIVIPAAIVLPILSESFLFEKKQNAYQKPTTSDLQKKPKKFLVKMSPAKFVTVAVLIVIVHILSICEQPILAHMMDMLQKSR